MKKEYIRVIPRDFFNEAKLLKCLGLVAIAVLDNKNGLYSHLIFNHEGEPFDIRQWDHDGSLYVANAHINKVSGGHKIDLFSPYNSKENFPLMFQFGDSCDCVFADNGEFSTEFLAVAKAVAR